MRSINKQTGTLITVGPMCLPGSGERVVKISENIGDTIEGLRMVLSALEKVCVEEPSSKFVPSMTTINKCLEGEESTKIVFNMGRETLWMKVFSFARKLGLKVIQLDQQRGTVEGNLGAVDMFSSVMAVKCLGTQDVDNNHGFDETVTSRPNDADLKATASYIAVRCNLPDM